MRALPNRSSDLPAMFVNINRSKRSVVLDLEEPAGKRALIRLFETADVVVQNSCLVVEHPERLVVSRRG